MSFWASSYFFQLEVGCRVLLLINVVLCGISFTTIVRKPARCSQGLLVSIESFDAILGRVQTRTFNRGSQCSMKLPAVQEQ